jgi:hypothetical protein
VKLTLTLDNDESLTINIEGELDNRLESLTQMCALLDMWAIERDREINGSP